MHVRTGEIEREVVIVACAVSAGVHAALVPTHLSDGTAAGAAFLAAAVLTAGLAVGLTFTTGPALVGLASLTLAGLILSYGLAATAGLPVVHPSPEPIDGLALATKLVEAAGLLAALDIVRRESITAAGNLRPKGTT